MGFFFFGYLPLNSVFFLNFAGKLHHRSHEDRTAVNFRFLQIMEEKA